MYTHTHTHTHTHKRAAKRRSKKAITDVEEKRPRGRVGKNRKQASGENDFSWIERRRRQEWKAGRRSTRWKTTVDAAERQEARELVGGSLRR